MKKERMTPKLFWEILESNLKDKNSSLKELTSILRKKGVRTNLWYYRRVPRYPPFSVLQYLKDYMNDDDLHEALLKKEGGLKKADDIEALLLSLKPSQSCIGEQRLRRKLQRQKK